MATITKQYTTSTHIAYDVTCFNHKIRSIVTCNPNIVTSWIKHVNQSSNNHKHHHETLIVGLDTEWLNPVAILQLCIGHDCLIYQLFHSTSVPTSLRDFLGDPTWKFSRISVVSDVTRLAKDYDLVVASDSIVDVSHVAAKEGRVRVNAGLKDVAKAVLGWEVEKPKKVTMSQWNKEVLDEEQVMYACIDAFLSYKIGKELIGHGSGDDLKEIDHKVFEEF